MCLTSQSSAVTARGKESPSASAAHKSTVVSHSAPSNIAKTGVAFSSDPFANVTSPASSYSHPIPANLVASAKAQLAVDSKVDSAIFAVQALQAEFESRVEEQSALINELKSLVSEFRDMIDTPRNIPPAPVVEAPPISTGPVDLPTVWKIVEMLEGGRLVLKSLPDLFDSIEDTLDRTPCDDLRREFENWCRNQGIQKIHPAPGDPFIDVVCIAQENVPTDQPECDGCVHEVLTTGYVLKYFLKGQEGRVILRNCYVARKQYEEDHGSASDHRY